MVVGGMSDPLDAFLRQAKNGKTIIKNRDVLHFTHMPDVVLHRDYEQKQTAQSLLPILKRARPSNLLVYGKTGTGKTLVVRRVLSKIQELAGTADFPIRLVYSNSKNETTIYGLLVDMGRQIGLDEKSLPPTGLSISVVFKKILDEIDGNQLNTIFVIDEIDHLARLSLKTKNDILYQLTRANERLKKGAITFVGISNDLTFKERLDPRVISSLGEEEVVFSNYNTGQIKAILSERVGQAFVEGAVLEPALNLCAAMAGSEHGDARRAIDLMRVAGEIAEREQAENVTDEHVRAAMQKIEENKEEASLRSYPLHEKLLIIAIMRDADLNTGTAYASYKRLCKAIGRDALTQRRITQMLGDIELSGMITGRLVSQGTHGRTKKYRLTIPPETVKKTFKSDEALSDIL